MGSESIPVDIFIREDILYTEFIDILSSSSDAERKKKAFKYFVITDRKEIKEEEYTRIDAIIRKKIKNIADGKMNPFNEAISILMDAGLSFSDAREIPASLGQIIIKKMFNKKIAEVKKHKELMENLEAKDTTTKVFSIFDEEAEKLMKKEE